MARLHKVIARFPVDNGNPNNNRPVQLLNGRVVRLRCGGKQDERSPRGQPALGTGFTTWT